MVIQKAISDYFVNGTKIEDFIKGHSNIYDFCGRQKFQSDSFGEIHYLRDRDLIKDKTQKVTRYYISTNGSSFIKNYINKQNEVTDTEFINKGNKVTIFNKFEDKSDYSINYNFYIKESKKILEEIEDKQLELF